VCRIRTCLFSMILVSYAVNIFKQNRIPDSGAAFFDMVVEPGRSLAGPPYP
jgi:hypothetical protein